MPVSELVKFGLTAGAVSFALSAMIVYSQKWHGKHSHDHDLDGVQKVHTTAVPRIGGLAVIAGIFFALLIFTLAYPEEIKESRITRIYLLLSASLPAFIAGIIEDITKKVSVKVRLGATISSALLASALLGATVDELDIWGIDTLLQLAPFAIMVTALVVAGGTNAINIIDGFNGLSTSVIVIMCAALGVVAWQVGDTFVALISALCMGATMGFFLVNYPSGKLFLGDGGAYFLGFWVSEIAVLLIVRNRSVNAWQVLAICAYPVIEVIFSIYRRKVVRNVNAGAPDALHMHTLVYRRVAPRFSKILLRHPWGRNASVTFIIVPWIALMAALSVLIGGTVVGGLVLVLIQAVLYVLLYKRIVRGRWRRAKQRKVPLAVSVQLLSSTNNGLHGRN
jgi:UDP-N-acetylmuramyl pentapeptide phosphotransferase/UDP-N-acetylglucosamine-1-phosphate transferase